MRNSSLVLLLVYLCGCVGEPEVVSGPVTETQEQPRPNLLLIVADDMGYTDIGAFGGEIDTPNLDSLAARGVKLTNFHAAPTCAPTRAILLSGTDNHTAGLGSMFGPLMLDGIENATGYERYLHERVAPLPAILADAGYHTYMAGKWHLGMEQHQWPSARGFERSFSLLPGSDDHFNPLLEHFQENGVALDALPADYYSTRVFTDKLIGYIDENTGDGQPFFAYAAFTSPHWPLQAPENFVDRYSGRYDEGYDAIRARRLERARALGVIPDIDAPLPEWLGPSWGEFSPEEQAGYARKMEIYAAMVENLDDNVGRLIDYLEQIGQLDNTVILFFSDNGAESDEMELNPTFAARMRSRGAVNTLETIGHAGSWASYGAGWAQVSMGPYRRFKGFSTEGGTR
ncbi:MAG: sulfatase-like hydrolase/transferase, partial [Gammaproteobacteria bacterium]|nr:sulfatase-like hydrolase/transferase [Gammaproteobacteria bacterium]